MMPFGHLFYWYSSEGIYSLYSSWSIASSIFKERPTLGFDCSGYSSVGSFLIGTVNRSLDLDYTAFHPLNAVIMSSCYGDHKF